MSEVMRNLECLRRSMAEAQSPVDVTTAEAALSQHSSIKKSIFAIPIDRLQSESDRVSLFFAPVPPPLLFFAWRFDYNFSATYTLQISERINRAQCGISNPDLVSSIPHMANLLTSLRALK